MDRWAVHYGARAAFVCVGCAGPGLASQFTKELKLSKCTVAYASQGSGPKWGQLGCSGFIVLDANLRVVCDATSPFLELRELAFGHVEALLDALVEGAPLPQLCPGQKVVLRGLQKAELNGKAGLCLEKPREDGRCGIALQDGRRLSVKLENLDAGNGPLVGGDCSGGGCGGGCGECAEDKGDEMPSRMAKAVQPAPEEQA